MLTSVYHLHLKVLFVSYCRIEFGVRTSFWFYSFTAIDKMNFYEDNYLRYKPSHCSYDRLGSLCISAKIFQKNELQKQFSWLIIIYITQILFRFIRYDGAPFNLILWKQMYFGKTRTWTKIPECNKIFLSNLFFSKKWLKWFVRGKKRFDVQLYVNTFLLL